MGLGSGFLQALLGGVQGAAGSVQQQNLLKQKQADDEAQRSQKFQDALLGGIITNATKPRSKFDLSSLNFDDELKDRVGPEVSSMLQRFGGGQPSGSPVAPRNTIKRSPTIRPQVKPAAGQVKAPTHRYNPVTRQLERI